MPNLVIYNLEGKKIHTSQIPDKEDFLKAHNTAIMAGKGLRVETEISTIMLPNGLLQTAIIEII